MLAEAGLSSLIPSPHPTQILEEEVRKRGSLFPPGSASCTHNATAQDTRKAGVGNVRVVHGARGARRVGTGGIRALCPSPELAKPTCRDCIEGSANGWLETYIILQSKHNCQLLLWREVSCSSISHFGGVSVRKVRGLRKKASRATRKEMQRQCRRWMDETSSSG